MKETPFEFETSAAYRMSQELAREIDEALQFSRKEQKPPRAPEEQALLDAVVSVAVALARGAGCRSDHCRKRHADNALKNAYGCVPMLGRVRAMGIITEQEQEQFREKIARITGDISNLSGDFDD